MMSLIFYYFFLMILIFLNDWVLLLNFFIMGFFYFFFNFSLNFYFSNLSYFFGLDLISYFLFFLSIWISYLMIISSFSYMKHINSSLFLFCVFFLCMFLIFSFSSLNIFMFYFFFESSLIPTLILIFGWGYQPERLSSGYYLLFYTLFGSLPLLLSIFYIYNFSNLLFFDLIVCNLNFYLYLGMILGFLFKMPMFIFHFWLPKAHVEAPISGSMILAAILLKLGGYGLIRSFKFMYMYMYILNNNMYIIILSLFGVIIISFICMYQFDMKSMIAYSSVCHMGLVIGGIFTLNYLGLLGSLVLMIGHGLCSSGLFCLANIVYERTKSRSFYLNKGLMNLMPSLCLFWFLFCCNNMASPPSLNLLGEIVLMNSLMSWCSLSFLFLFFSCFLSCCYSIYLYSNLQHGMYYGGLKFFFNVNIREYYLLLMHFVPLNFMILNCDIYFIWN